MLNSLDKTDAVTKLISRALDFLFLYSPQRTSLGLVMGVFIKGAVEIILQVNNYPINVPYEFCLSSGILLLHLPNIFSKHKIDEEIEAYLHYLLEVQRNGNFSPSEMRAQWRRLVELIYAKTNLSPDGGDDNNVQKGKPA